MEKETKKARIYIIEDEALVARELKSRLHGLGYDVVGMAYGLAGLGPAIEARPDLLLIDINLKDCDGIELASEINARWPVPVVFLTAYSDRATVSRAKRVAPYGYIIKPAENRELEITIEIALYKFAIERELKQTQALLSNALTCIGDALVFVDADGTISHLQPAGADPVRAYRDRGVLVPSAGTRRGLLRPAVDCGCPRCRCRATHRPDSRWCTRATVHGRWRNRAHRARRGADAP